MMVILYIAIIGIALIYGGIVDAKRQQIPHSVPIILFLSAFILDFSIFRSMMCLAVITVAQLIAEKICKDDVAGGDFKLFCALGFAIGLFPLFIVIAIVLVEICIMSIFKRQFIKNVPLCAYVAPAFFIMLCGVFYLGGN